MSEKCVIFWHRRDLRYHDNAGLQTALETELPVIPLFIFDKEILDLLEDKDDARVTFIHDHCAKLNTFYQSKGGGLHVYHDKPIDVFRKLLETHNVAAVYTNEDYEPYARDRDQQVRELLSEKGVMLHSFKDHVIMHPDEILKDDGDPYVVFTPYSKKWRANLTEKHYTIFPSAEYYTNFSIQDAPAFPSLEDLGFSRSDIQIPSDEVSNDLIQSYEAKRNFPAQPGTSRLGVHLRFGTISIRELLNQSYELSFTYVNELIWREFYQQILWHFPRVVTENFRRKYDAVEWKNDPEDFRRWCEGKTGYPIVDAGMRELNATGYMHNRVRMIVASFLTKHLLIDWRWGEAYFARKLLDYELASNNGGWQWASGTGTDAQPYFRIFNPYSQTEKFDKHHEYIRRWAPDSNEIQPIVEHSAARTRALDVYKAAVG